ncbi:LamB/YcsF family protein [Cupriavidus sp. L7L]|uniref:LamB/YcsF family protein n=1 Tax=Cupriavidus sp. L7L TaxID=2546443 RepID=UPI0010549295|nr:5-oxoprolinase subunit PxpA [Cupriavidus sp. L7L]TDF61923.1 LamB/YcsF family protein [Cupriavidus sp. L7L]
MKIDINSDMGEAFGPYRMGDDDTLLTLVSSANIACGFHAGDPDVMAHTVATAIKNGVDIGAHPGFDDKRHFGRRRLPTDAKSLKSETLYQLGALDAIAREQGARVSHLSFHGALGNILYKDRELADVLVGAVAAFNRDIIFPVTPNTATEAAAIKHGLRTVRKFFADRAYDSNGLLVPRGTPGSIIHDHDVAAKRVLQLLDSGTVTTIDGETLRMQAQVVMVHSETPGAVELARAIRNALETNGGEIVPMSKLV